MRTFSLAGLVLLVACVSYPEDAKKLNPETAQKSQTYAVPLALGAVRSKLHEYEKFCNRPVQDITLNDPENGSWSKYTAGIIGDTREVLLIRLKQIEPRKTEITGYAEDDRWLPYTESFVNVVLNSGSCSANI